MNKKNIKKLIIRIGKETKHEKNANHSIKNWHYENISINQSIYITINIKKYEHNNWHHDKN